MDADADVDADVDAVHVVVPAHDEQTHVGACLESVLTSIDRLRAEQPRIDVHVLVVLDRCTDGTAAVVAGVAGLAGPADPGLVTGLPVEAGSVGAARRAGLDRVTTLAADREHDPSRVWVCNTDADCVVPGSWLVDHLALARGHDLVQGEVRPADDDLPAAVLGAWDARNPAGRGSLHGANLGFRLSAYLDAGGFPAVADGEDLLLVRAMKARGARAVGGTRVLTSGRRDGRVPLGFAGYLRALEAELSGLTEPVVLGQDPGSGSTSSAASTSSSTSRST